MSYIETQRKRAIEIRDLIFRDPGNGIFKKREREFVLNDAALNIWAGVRHDAIAYFNRHSIPFWVSGNEPTGHLLSSQIACINHLYFVRQRQDTSTAILQGVDKNVKCALRMDNGVADSGFVDFEVIGAKNYLGEKQHTRGANATSVDAMMLAEMKNGIRKLYFIEWKYVENYKSQPSKAEGKSGQTRLNIYKPLLEQTDCPVIIGNINGLFTEPYYQLLRQTLLANEMTKAKEYGATDYHHLHIIPTANKELKNVNTAAGKLDGKGLHDTWKNQLRSPGKYQTIDPNNFISPAKECLDSLSAINYLEQRYWN
ncbi:MAG: hypothetical protein JJU13_12550 [Balneolaceae bacterium]|nr:hypothetical protein [Balneolaceae bacterium]